MRGSVIRRERKDGSSVWCIKYLDASGKQKWETIGPNKRVAERVLAERIRDAHYGEVRDNSTTFEDFLPTWRERKAHEVRDGGMESLESHVRNHLEPIFADVKLRELNLQTVQTRLVDRWEGHPGTLRKVLSTLHGIVKAAAVRGLMEPLDFTSLQLPRHEKQMEPVALTLPQVMQIVEKIDERYAPDVLFLAVTGLRVGEWVTLLKEDVHLDERKMWIHRVRTRSGKIDLPKRDKRRWVLLFDKAVEAYERRQAINKELGLDSELAFPSVTGEMIHPSNFYSRVWRPAVVAAGFPELRLHDLRHTAASLMIRAGAPPQFVANQLGHSDPTFTLRTYVHWFEEQNQEVLDAINANFGGEDQ